MMDYVLKADSIEVRVSGSSYRACAEELFDCAVNFHTKRQFSPVPYMRLCRAIEMKLKSHHLATMIQPQLKKSFGHNLVKSYKALSADLQTLSAAELQLLQDASSIYIDDKGFDYVAIKDMCEGYRRFPDLQALTDLTQKLLEL